MQHRLVLLPTIAGLVACTPASQTPGLPKLRVILDTDANNELDDQHAIAYLLMSGDRFAVDGITVNATRNGGDVAEHAAEAERIVQLCDRAPHIWVYQGANGNFEAIRDHVHEAEFDGAEAVNYIVAAAHEDRAEPLVLLPVGKLTNIALALEKDPSIAAKVRIVWLGSNYPEPGEYNQVNDEAALQYLLEHDVPLEIAVVRYGDSSGTDAVRVTLDDMAAHMPGAGPHSREPVVGRHGGEFTTFGDYAMDLFRHAELYGDPPSRALFDMAAVAIVKNPAWATRVEIPAPRLEDGEWHERPDNPRRIVIWEHFDREAILEDFFATMREYVLVQPR